LLWRTIFGLSWLLLQWLLLQGRKMQQQRRLPLILFLADVRWGFRGLEPQKKGVLSESALPEELRLALAQNMQNDMFHQV
jgi:hypothetical protein